MQEIRESALTAQVLKGAEETGKAIGCGGVPRDLIFLSAMRLLQGAEHVSQEAEAARALLLPFRQDASAEEEILCAWRDKTVSMTEKIILQAKKSKARRLAEGRNLIEIPLDLCLQVLLEEPTDVMLSLIKGGEPRVETRAIPEARAAATPAANDAKPEPEKAQEASTGEAGGSRAMAEILSRTREMQRQLQQEVLGQPYAVSTFASGYFHAELQALIAPERRRPRATFLFAGPPGVGKTLLTETAARILGLPFLRVDMSEYTGAGSVQELMGSSKTFSGARPGVLTDFVRRNPHSIILLDEIEKADLRVIHLFLQVLDAGQLRDNYLEKEVFFRDTILVFTTNAGREMYEQGRGDQLSRAPREVILDALSRETSPMTGEPLFPQAILSRFAAGNVVAFNRLPAHVLRSIAEHQLRLHMERLRESVGIEAEMDERVATTILFSEGAGADARMVHARADAFFSSELYELFRIMDTPEAKADMGTLRKIGFTVDTDHADEEVRSLLIPNSPIHVLIFGEADALPELPLAVFHRAKTPEEARKILSGEEISLVLFDLLSRVDRASQVFLNVGDEVSEDRAFLHSLLERHPDLPVMLLERDGAAFYPEEKEAYLQKGVRGFLELSGDDIAKRLSHLLDTIFQQQSLTSLARANRVVRYETAQALHSGGTEAEIVLFDMHLEKAVKSGDAANVLSMLSVPKDTFGDVIGCEDAKNELSFFVSYMKNPRKYLKKGTAAPKGILLYGPPGTGKTMLARAFAAESGATFIAAEGNQFSQKYRGDGKSLVHRLFAIARRYAPSVIFIDEIDCIAAARKGNEDPYHEYEATLTALLGEMDGFSSDMTRPVFVLGATNYEVNPEEKMHLDPALLRRFDRQIYMDMPKSSHRRQYLEKQLREKPYFQISRSEMDSLVGRSVGMSLAQISSVLDLAVRESMQKELVHVGDGELEEAFEKWNSGEEKKRDAESILRCARHESGHALIEWLCGGKMEYLTMVSRADHGGYMQRSGNEEKTLYVRREMLEKIRVFLGGRAAEILYYGQEEGLSTGASADLRAATNLATAMVCDYGMAPELGSVTFQGREKERDDVRAAVSRIMSGEMDKALSMLQEHRGKLERLVEELLKTNSLKGDEIDRILREAED